MGNAGYGNHTEKTKDYVDPERPDPQAGPMDSPEKHPGKAERGKEPPPSAGPHDKPSLTNADATPGTGALPTPGETDGMNSTGG